LLSDGEIAGLAVGVTAFIGVILFGVVKLISL